MKISDSTRLLQACRAIISAERESVQPGTTMDQLAARLLLLSDRIRALAVVVEEIELSR